MSNSANMARKRSIYGYPMPNISQTHAGLRLGLSSALALLLVMPSFQAVAQSRPAVSRPHDGATITPNYKDADLTQIIQAVGEVTGKNFIVDPRVNAKVTMLSATPMSPEAFYEAFLAVLQVYGYVAVPAGKVIKIIPEYRRPAAALDRPAEQRQLHLGRDRHADHHDEERQRRPAGAVAAAADSTAGPPRGLSRAATCSSSRIAPVT